MKREEIWGLVGFDELQVCCIIGDLEWERGQKQYLLVDLRVEADFAPVVASDELKDTIDYVRLSQICQEIGEKGKYNMVEKYAAEVLTVILDEFAVKSVWIRVRKPKGLEQAAGGAVVELKRYK